MPGSNGGTGPLDCPKRTSVPRGRRRVQALLEGGGANGVVDDIDTFAVGQPFGFGFEVLFGVEDDFVGSRVSCELGFGLRRDRADYAGADILRELRDEQARSACRRVHERSVADSSSGNVDRVR